MSYTALYRKFRPQTLDEVRGQEVVVTTLKNQLRTGRVGHAYLFCGTRGTGKTTIAKILARAVNCEHPTGAGPCNECPTCRSILSGASTGVIEIDAASNNGVDNIREIREQVEYRPTSGKYKVYIIDEVHMLSSGAFNALLKTLEEPPEYVIFILATTEAGKIPVTILSRCQRYDFRRISADTIAGHMKELLKEEGASAEEKAIRYIARAADGSMRDALSLLDQCISFYPGEELTYDQVLSVLGTVDTEVFGRLLDCVADGDASGSIRILGELVQSGKEMGQFTADFTWYLRNLMLLEGAEDMDDAVDASAEQIAEMREQSRKIGLQELMRYIRVFSDLAGSLRNAPQKRVLVETALIRLCRPQMSTGRDAILQRIRILEKKLEEGVFLTAEMAAAAGTPGISAGTGTAGQPAGAAGEAGEGGNAGTGNAAAPPKAAPEDLREITASWRKIIAMCPPMMGGFLSKGVPMYDPEKNASVLLLSFTDQNACWYFQKNELHMQDLHGILRKATGKEVPVEILAGSPSDPQQKGLAPLPVEEIFENEIDFPVEEEYDE